MFKNVKVWILIHFASKGGEPFYRGLSEKGFWVNMDFLLELNCWSISLVSTCSRLILQVHFAAGSIKFAAKRTKIWSEKICTNGGDVVVSLLQMHTLLCSICYILFSSALFTPCR